MKEILLIIILIICYNINDKLSSERIVILNEKVETVKIYNRDSTEYLLLIKPINDTIRFTTIENKKCK